MKVSERPRARTAPGALAAGPANSKASREKAHTGARHQAATSRANTNPQNNDAFSVSTRESLSSRLERPAFSCARSLGAGRAVECAETNVRAGKRRESRATEKPVGCYHLCRYCT